MLSADELRKAMRRAFDLGQTYWMHADSESYIQHQKADRVRERFHALMEETVTATCGVVASQVPQPLPVSDNAAKGWYAAIADAKHSARKAENAWLVEKLDEIHKHLIGTDGVEGRKT